MKNERNKILYQKIKNLKVECIQTKISFQIFIINSVESREIINYKGETKQKEEFL